MQYDKAQLKDYWQNKHQIYSTQAWINETNIFAHVAVEYLPKSGSLLELGAGQGQDSRYFAKLGYEVISTDLSEFALQASKEKAEAGGLILKFINLDIAENLPFADNSFDVVYSHLALHYFDDAKTRDIFREIRRVLKPDGILAGLFNAVNDPDIVSGKYTEIEKDFYLASYGLTRRFFSLDYFKDVSHGLFETLLLDDKGETYKDEFKSLIRFVGRAVK